MIVELKTKFNKIQHLHQWFEETYNFIMPVFLSHKKYPELTLSNEECRELIDHANMRVYNIRKTLQRGSRDVHPSNELAPIQKIKNLALEVNRLTYNYDLDEHDFECIIHKFQNGMGYCFHQDINSYRPYCKLSVSVQLNDLEGNTGGDLVFFENGKPEDDFVIPREQGAVTVFPPFLHHKVSTVKSGVRNSLVLFFYGPRFK